MTDKEKQKIRYLYLKTLVAEKAFYDDIPGAEYKDSFRQREIALQEVMDALHMWNYREIESWVKSQYWHRDYSHDGDGYGGIIYYSVLKPERELPFNQSVEKVPLNKLPAGLPPIPHGIIR